MTFTQSLAIFSEYHRNMGKFWHFKPKGFIKGNLFGGIRYVVIPSNNVGNAHIGIIHNTCKVVSRKSVRLEDYKILDERRIKGDRTMNKVIKFCYFILHPETNGFTSLCIDIIKCLSMFD